MLATSGSGSAQQPPSTGEQSNTNSSGVSGQDENPKSESYNAPTSTAANNPTTPAEFKFSPNPSQAWPASSARPAGSAGLPWDNAAQFGGMAGAPPANAGGKMEMAGGWGEGSYHVDMFGQSFVPSYPAMAAAAAAAASANQPNNNQYKIRP